MRADKIVKRADSSNDLKALLDADVDDLLSGQQQKKAKQGEAKDQTQEDSGGWKGFGGLFGRKDKIEDQPKLSLGLPHISKAHQPPSLLKPEPLKEKLSAVANQPITLLREASAYLKSLNQYQTKPELRLKLTETVLRYVMVLAGKLYIYFLDQGSGVPEPRERGDLLLESAEAVQQTAISFMQLFKQDFELPPKALTKVEDRFLLVGLRVLELVRIKQRLSALRYQKLPPETWTQCNHIYFVLMERGLADKSIPLLRCPGFSGGTEDRPNYVLGQSGTVNQIFVSIQLFGLMDCLVWRNQFTSAIDAYLQSGSLFRIIADDGSTLTDCFVISYRGQSTPPRFDRVGTGDRAAILIDFTRMHQQLQVDKKALEALALTDENAKGTSNYSQEQVPKSLADVDAHNRSFVNGLMRYKLHKHTRKNSRTPTHSLDSFDMHFGFANCIRVFEKGFWAEGSEKLESKKTPRGRKGNLQKKEDPLQWRKVDDSREGIKLSVNLETQLKEPMFVGQLVVFWEKQKNAGEVKLLYHDTVDAGEFQLGFIQRFERFKERRLEMVVIKLSMEADHVRLTDPSQPDSAKVYNGLFMTTLEEEWKLVTPHSPTFVPDTALVMLQNNNRMPLQLEAICHSTEEFEIFEASVYT